MALCTVLGEYSNIDKDHGKEFIDRAISLLIDAKQQYGHSSDLCFRLGNKYVFLGKMLNDSKKFELANESYKEAIELDILNVGALVNWGHSEILQSIHEEDEQISITMLNSAKEKLSKAVEAAPGVETTWYNLGCVEFEMAKKNSNENMIGFLDSAIVYFEKAETILPGISTYELARVFALRGWQDRALSCLEKWIQGSDGNTEIIQEERDFDVLKGNSNFDNLTKNGI